MLSLIEENMLPVHLNVMNLDEAWHQALRHCFMYGSEYKVTSGSYEGQMRYGFDSFSCFVKEPHKEMIPKMPEGSGLIPPTSMEYVENYFATYLMSDAKTEHEDYTYGERLVEPRYRSVRRPERKDEAVVNKELYDFSMGVNQIEEVIKELIYSKGGSNQTCMEIAMPNDVLLNDPPCLRLIDVRMRFEKLHFFVYFRSWDLYSGFPANLAAIELMKQYMVSELNERGLKVGNGSMTAFSKGLHIYSQYYDVVEARWGKKKEELRKEGRDRKDLESIIVYNGIKN